ncbi:uncharacterized protein [Antedon mediterranea]|uniref:uncharacterized protein n=1 Tax=Antedon mediterranea TaxID=105859 RepID=UPI003AF835F2
MKQIMETNADDKSRLSVCRLTVFVGVLVVSLTFAFSLMQIYTRNEHLHRISDLEKSVADLKITVNELEHIIGDILEKERTQVNSPTTSPGFYKRRRRDISESAWNVLQGPMGPHGRDGSDGRDGRDGTPGIPGSPGLAGIAGDRGQKGDLGDDGPRGIKGTHGAKGEPGKQGPVGAKGDACEFNPQDVASIFIKSIDDQNLNETSPNTLGIFGGGSVYIRWGRTTCPNTGTDLVYEGIAAGSWYNYKGGSSEYVCLPLEPDWDKFSDVSQSLNSKIYGAEYETAQFDPFEHDNAATLTNHNVPCAVCRVPTRATEFMVPAKTSCPERWTKEYSGYLMTSQLNSFQKTQYICVDRSPEVVQGTGSDQNGALLYPVEGACGSLPCLPYVAGRELTCAVCTI